jgi:hypothetical protein
VANEADEEAATTKLGVFGAFHCDSLSYWLKVKRDQFKLDEFYHAVRETGVKEESTSAACSPRDPASGYHLHVSWRELKNNEFSINVEFISESREHGPGEREPFAETFFQWLNQFFFVKEPVRAHMHAEFCFPSSMRTARPLLLPLKTALGPKNIDVEIDGLSFSVEPSVEGIERIWITQRKKDLWIYLIGDRFVNLEKFDTGHEISVLSKALDTLQEEAKQ